MNKDVRYIHTSSITVSTFDSPKSIQTVSHNNSCTSPVVSSNNVLPNVDKEKSQSVYNWDAAETEILKPVPEQTTVLGRRIIDFEYFFNALKKINKHSLSGCNLNDIIITNERKKGLYSSYHLKCTMCDFEHVLWTECPKKFKNVNTDVVAGMLSINCNFYFINKLLSKMDLPRLTRPVVTRERDKIYSGRVKEGKGKRAKFSSCKKKGDIKIADQSLKFPTINDKSSKECEKASDSSSQIELCQASTSANKKITKTNSNFVEKKQKSRSPENLVSASLHENKSYQQVNLNTQCESQPELLSLPIINSKASSTSPNKKIHKILKTNYTQKQKSKPFENLISAPLDKNKSYQRVNLNRLIEDKFQIGRNSAYNESEPELILPHDIELEKSGGNLASGTEQANFDITRTKQKINSDMHDDKLTEYKNSEMEIVNNGSFIGCADTSKVMLSQQKNARACNDKIIVDRKNKLNYIEL